ncbi:MAG: hypothetical protein KBD64_01060 [Gammaproteobacteria bacterium]|nr:hypothetical protein [Gammaproteobacteria bacterium]
MDEQDIINSNLDCEEELEVIELESEIKTKSRKRRKKDKPKNDVPSVHRAWKVGYSAAQANIPEVRNPFLDESSEYEAWLDGWWSGFYDEPMNYSFAVASNV